MGDYFFCFSLVETAYCNGTRSYNKKKFGFGLPLLLPIAVENLTSAQIKNIPEEIVLSSDSR